MNDKAPQITPASLEVMNIPIQMVAWVDPREYPEGMDLVVLKPGGIQPVGQIHVMPGAAIMAVPPPFAAKLVQQVKAQPNPGPGGVKAPGLH